MEPTILYEDDDIAAVYKPAGLIVHADGKRIEANLSDWVLQKYPQTKTVGEPAYSVGGKEIIRPGIVHRLDRETSGVILVAKTTLGFNHLKKQFQEHTIKKEYHAFVYGEMEISEQVPSIREIINRPIGRSAQDFRKWSAQRGAKGELREAITEYVVVSCGKGYSFVHAYPITGRTHQIRVHFKAINHPLVSDSLYAPKHENILGFSRLALHSYKITFLTVRGQSQTVIAPYPEDFITALFLYKL